MIRLCCAFILISTSIYSKTAVVRVLEAPLFQKKSTKSFVVQYKRKGDEIFIHDKEDEKSAFYKTMTTTGDEVYVLKKHLYVYYENSRELEQKALSFDDTDYRIEEPLPEGYPLRQPTGYRGQFFVSLGPPNKDSYPYAQTTLDSGFGFNKSFGFVWQREVDYLKSKRFFHGAILNISTLDKEFIFSGSSATEKHNLVSAGPYLSYDAYKTKKHIINLHSALEFNFVDKIEVTRSGSSADYSALSLSLKIGSTFHFQDVLGPLDIITGFNLDLHPPKTYETAAPNGLQTSFTTGFTAQVGYLVGIQSNY